MQEKLSVTQIAARIGMSERTALRWLHDGKLSATRLDDGKWLMMTEDLERVSPSEKIDGLERRIEQLAQRVDKRDERIEVLEQEIELFKSRIEALETQKQAAPVSRPVVRATTQHVTLGEAVPTRTFAEMHEVTRWSMEGWINRHEVETTPTNRGSKIQHTLNLEQQAAMIHFWQEHNIPYKPCEQCPHDTQSEHEQKALPLE